MIKLGITNNLIVTDSTQILNDLNAPMYAVVSVSGSKIAIEHAAEVFNDELFDGRLDLASFEKWMTNQDNQIKLFKMLLTLYSDPDRCLFHCYLSDHIFSKFLFMVKTILPDLNLGDLQLQKEVESLYADFDKTFLHLKCSEITDDVVRKIYSFFESVSIRAKYKDLYTGKTNVDFVHIKRIITMLSMSDLSLFDYANYSHVLLGLLDGFEGDKTIFAYGHSFDGLDFCKKSMLGIFNQNQNQFELEKLNSANPDVIDIFINNLMVVFHYLWSRLHHIDSVNSLNEYEKLQIPIIWMLFQSQNSGWMISIDDFRKIKQLLDEMKDR